MEIQKNASFIENYLFNTKTLKNLQVNLWLLYKAGNLNKYNYEHTKSLLETILEKILLGNMEPNSNDYQREKKSFSSFESQCICKN